MKRKKKLGEGESFTDLGRLESAEARSWTEKRIGAVGDWAALPGRRSLGAASRVKSSGGSGVRTWRAWLGDCRLGSAIQAGGAALGFRRRAGGATEAGGYGVERWKADRSGERKA
ncbi:hypothetical protein FNV43_RR09275 [Rhamnella rubrinervis]|uniref:Uncharacterized protein n=1 Tax=Rhamnella rubrinervis TaxID=2594499 RepID=A0A8K0H9P2_9ROSA|nr:hypothetical protein FNV43_RR09275 [Rhamnella rubrinervis]